MENTEPMNSVAVVEGVVDRLCKCPYPEIYTTLRTILSCLSVGDHLELWRAFNEYNPSISTSPVFDPHFEIGRIGKFNILRLLAESPEVLTIEQVWSFQLAFDQKLLVTRNGTGESVTKEITYGELLDMYNAGELVIPFEFKQVELVGPGKDDRREVSQLSGSCGLVEKFVFGNQLWNSQPDNQLVDDVIKLPPDIRSRIILNAIIERQFFIEEARFVFYYPQPLPIGVANIYLEDYPDHVMTQLELFISENLFHPEVFKKLAALKWAGIEFFDNNYDFVYVIEKVNKHTDLNIRVPERLWEMAFFFFSYFTLTP